MNGSLSPPPYEEATVQERQPIDISPWPEFKLVQEKLLHEEKQRLQEQDQRLQQMEQKFRAASDALTARIDRLENALEVQINSMETQSAVVKALTERLVALTEEQQLQKQKQSFQAAADIRNERIDELQKPDDIHNAPTENQSAAIEAPSVRMDVLLDDKLQEQEQRLRAAIGALEERIDGAENAPELNVNSRESQVESTSLKTPKLRRGTSFQKQRQLEEAHEVEFAESVWDAGFAFNLGLLNKRELIQLALCMLINFFIQFFYIIAVKKLCDQQGYSETLVNDLRTWRVKYGHVVETASVDTNVPLAAIVCQSGGRYVEITGGRQASKYDEIAYYLDQALHLPLGLILSGLAVTLWSLSCLNEYLSLFFFQWGLTKQAIKTWHDDRSACTDVRICYEGEVDVWYEVKTVSWQYALFIALVVTLPRFILASLLCVYGTLYLTKISTLEDIILNAVALNVVLSVDEAIFQGMAPDRLHTFIRHVKPLKIHKGKSFACTLPTFKFTLVAGLIFFSFFGGLLPMQDLMTQAKAEMCDGYKDFVVRQDLAQSYTIHLGKTVASTRKEMQNWGDEFQLVRHRAVLQATALECQKERLREGDTSCSDSRTSMPPSTKFVDAAVLSDEIPEQLYIEDTRNSPVRVGIWQQIMTSGIRDKADEAYCFDFDEHPWTSLTEKVSTRVALQEFLTPWELIISDCASIKNLCGHVAHWSSSSSLGNVLRLSCPHTCGCTEPKKGQLHGGSEYGCPSVCGYTFDDELKSSPCEDVADGDAGLEEYMKRYQELFYYDAVVSKHAEDGASIPVSCKSWSENGGSLRWSNWSIGPVSACDPSTADIFWDYGLRSIRPLCPETCGCFSAPEAAECPRTCAMRGHAK